MSVMLFLLLVLVVVAVAAASMHHFLASPLTPTDLRLAAVDAALDV